MISHNPKFKMTSVLPHLAFDSKGELQPIGMNMDIFKETKVSDIPDEIGLFQVWSAMHLVQMMAKQSVLHLETISQKYMDLVEKDAEAILGCMRAQKTVNQLMIFGTGVNVLIGSAEADDDQLKPWCDALDSEKVDVFDMLPLMYRILDKVEDLELGACAYFYKQERDDEMIRTLAECGKVATAAGLLRVQLRSIIKAFDDGSVEMKSD